MESIKNSLVNSESPTPPKAIYKNSIYSAVDDPNNYTVIYENEAKDFIPSNPELYQKFHQIESNLQNNISIQSSGEIVSYILHFESSLNKAPDDLNKYSSVLQAEVHNSKFNFLYQTASNAIAPLFKQKYSDPSLEIQNIAMSFNSLNPLQISSINAEITTQQLEPYQKDEYVDKLETREADYQCILFLEENNSLYTFHNIIQRLFQEQIQIESSLNYAFSPTKLILQSDEESHFDYSLYLPIDGDTIRKIW